MQFLSHNDQLLTVLIANQVDIAIVYSHLHGCTNEKPS